MERPTLGILTEFFTTHASSTSHTLKSQKETHRFKTYNWKNKKKKVEVVKSKRRQGLVNSQRKQEELRRASSTYLPDNSDIEESVGFQDSHVF